MSNKVHIFESSNQKSYRFGDMFMLKGDADGQMPHVVMLVCPSYEITHKRNLITLISLETGNRWAEGLWVSAKQETFTSSEIAQLTGRGYAFSQVFNVEIKRGE